MQKFTIHQGLVAPMDRENVDTDAIIPGQFLVDQEDGLRPQPVRRMALPDKGEPAPESQRKPNPDFVR